MTVKNAVAQAYQNLSDRISILDLIRDTRNIYGRQTLTDGTITRKLRELRSDKVLNYKIEEQMYVKIFKEIQTIMF
jgi:hypothetical protein